MVIALGIAAAPTRAATPQAAASQEVDVQALADSIVREAEILRAEVRRLQEKLARDRMSYRELEEAIARLQRDLADLQAGLEPSDPDGPLAGDVRPSDRLCREVEALRQLLVQVPAGKLLVQGILIDPLNPINPPPAIEGSIVLSPGRDQVKIDRGAADGLRPHHHLEVYQAGSGKYLGRIEIMSTTPHGALAAILPEHRRAAIFAGARISTAIE